MEPSSEPLRIRRRFTYAPPPWRVFEALVEEVEKWWCHRVDPRAEVSFEPFEGGRFVQRVGEQDVEYARVARIERPALLRLEGTFGMAGDVHNVVTLSLGPYREGTALVVDHECRTAVGRDPRLLPHAWGELLGGYLREWMDTEFPPVGPRVDARFPLTR